jgi:hypothetical protein
MSDEDGVRLVNAVAATHRIATLQLSNAGVGDETAAAVVAALEDQVR